MKKLLFTALIAAFALTACGTKNTVTERDEAGEAPATSEVLGDIAFVQVDAVLAQCDLYINEGKALQEKTQKAQNSWAQRERNLQAEAAQLQEKYQRGLITTIDAQAQQQSLERRVTAFQNSAQKEAQTIEEENYVFTNRIQDLLHRAITEINVDKTYKMIVNGSALLDADPSLDITTTVLAKVNELYAKEKAEKK